MAESRKRAAIESPSALVDRNSPDAAPRRRPPSTVLGALFIFARAIAGLLWLGAFLWVWPELAAEEKLSPGETRAAAWVVTIVSGIGILTLLVLTWLIWRGSNAARIWVMSGLTLSITSAAIGYFTLGEEITIRTTLVVLALDILVLLALSSRDSRAWARRPRATRRVR